MDEAVFRRQVLEHKDRVFTYAAWLLKDREEARDVVQEALVRLWKNRDKIRPRTARGWLLKTTYRLCIDRVRRRKVRREVHGESLLDPAADTGPTPERLAVSGETGKAIEGALRELSAKDRAIVILREVQGMAYEEIAHTMEMPLGTVKAKLHRARDRLRRELSAAGVGP
jgi:RNA polymerase sigma-70 factor (ECF subfamily)